MSLGYTLQLRLAGGGEWGGYREEYAKETEKEQLVRYKNQACVVSWKPK